MRAVADLEAGAEEQPLLKGGVGENIMDDSSDSNPGGKPGRKEHTQGHETVLDYFCDQGLLNFLIGSAFIAGLMALVVYVTPTSLGITLAVVAIVVIIVAISQLMPEEIVGIIMAVYCGVLAIVGGYLTADFGAKLTLATANAEPTKVGAFKAAYYMCWVFFTTLWAGPPLVTAYFANMCASCSNGKLESRADMGMVKEGGIDHKDDKHAG